MNSTNMMNVLDEHKTTIPDALYIDLCEAISKVHVE
jgi:hypothetical protein